MYLVLLLLQTVEYLYRFFDQFAEMANNDGISGLISEKLDKNNFHAWKFRMTNFLMGKGYWEYIKCDQVAPPQIPEANATPAEVEGSKRLEPGEQGRLCIGYLSLYRIT